jgi:hypothetical protein
MFAVCCDATLSFCGAVPEPSSLHVAGGSGVGPQVRVTSHLGAVDCLPQGKLDKSIVAYRPLAGAGAVPRPLGCRDVMPDGTVLYGVDLDYAFEQEQAGSVSVTPTWPGLNGVLYESCFVAQLYRITAASDGRVLGSGDAWPSAVKLPKGRYCCRLSVSADSIDALQVCGGKACVFVVYVYVCVCVSAFVCY